MTLAGSAVCTLYIYIGNVYKTLIRKAEGKRQLGRPRHRWEEKIKSEL
jgi:hypothetical protein